MKKSEAWFRRVVGVLANRRFWWFVLALLVVQAAWIALSGKYPMAFDEDFHLGIIKLYAHHLSPFWAHQPESADRFGAVARDPSYLYQYLMAFPYRVLSAFIHSQTTIVIIFRFINIGFFSLGLILFKRLLIKTDISRSLVHLSLLIFVLLPIVPLLAAQINYDNLLLPLVASVLLLTVGLEGGLAQSKLEARTLLLLLITCLFTSLVKYAFLPIFVAIVIFLMVRVWQTSRPLRWYMENFVKSWQALNAYVRIGLLIGLVLSAGLFTQRIGYNLIRYRSPSPDCSRVLTIEQCSEYGPWIRDYNFKLNRVAVSRSPIAFSANWLYGMWLRTFFAVGGPETTFETRGPLTLPGIGAIAFAALGLIAFAVKAQAMLRRYNAPVIWLCLAVAASYVVFLWLDEYAAYLRTGQPVAINGRYLLPVLLPLILLMATAVAMLTRGRLKLQLAIGMVVVLCLAWGGGVLTFVLRSHDAWYWDSAAARSANHAVQKVVGPVTPGYRSPTQFLR